jgi:predicted nucleic acid-binding protein
MANDGVRQSGRMNAHIALAAEKRISYFFLIIAATRISLGLSLATLDPRGYGLIEGLDIARL